MIVSAALSLMLTLGAGLTAPDGCQIVAVAEDGNAYASCADGKTWFVYDPDITHDGMWSLVHDEPPQVATLNGEMQKTA